MTRLPGGAARPRRPQDPMAHVRIADLQAVDRPRERLAALGPEALSHAELIALVVGKGTPTASALDVANRLFSDAGDLASLARLPFDLLRRRPGFGDATAARLLAALELGRRLATATQGERPLIDSPEAAARQLVPWLSPLPQEHVVVLLLDAQNRLIRRDQVHRGTIDGCDVHPAEVLRPALLAGAPTLILAHNHPSGDPTPSRDDLAVTRRVHEAARLLRVTLSDHLVVAGGQFRSIRTLHGERAGFGP